MNNHIEMMEPMRIKFVKFKVKDGYLDHWLLAGPQKLPVKDEILAARSSPEQFAQLFDDPVLGISELPVERGPLSAGVFQIGEFSSGWDYFPCQEDHRVDQSAYVAERVYLRSWAYQHLYNSSGQTATLEITCRGPLRVWLNGAPLHYHEQFAGLAAGCAQEDCRFTVSVALHKGANPLFVRFENVGQGHSLHYFTARVIYADPIETWIPSLIKSLGRRNHLEKVFHSLYLERDVCSTSQQIRLHWPTLSKSTRKDENAYASVRLMRQSRIYAEAEVDGTPGDQLLLGGSAQYPEGMLDVFLMPKSWEYYEHNLRITHRLSFWNTSRQAFSEQPQGTPASRKQEALAYAALQEPASVEREMARMALSRWDMVEEKVLLEAASRARRGQVDSLPEMLALLGLLARFGDQEPFSHELKAAIEQAALAYRYDAAVKQSVSTHPQTSASIRVHPRPPSVPTVSESRQLVAAACQILAGQSYPEKIFAESGQTGIQLRQEGESQALAWMRQRGAWGLAQWGSEPGTIEILAALAYLVDLSDTEALWEMAGVLLDKLLFTLALNSFKGVYGGTSSQIYALSLKGGIPSAFGAVARLMWGQGLYTPLLTGLVSLACNQNYDLPAIFEQVGAYPPEELWSKERHAGSEGQEGANQAAYKTPDYLLASLQSYRPGQPGCGEHVWQATLGPGTIVFTNHPGCSGSSETHAPGYWRGNGTLPRVAQWKDALVSLYHLPQDAPLQFTHAYFPTFAFDEYVLKKGWAFARKGSAYLALAAAQPLTLTQSGPYAFRELRSGGRDNAWFCQLGRAARDGDFTAFQQKVLALPFEYQHQSARVVTLGGDQLEIGWQGPFYVNGSEEPLSGYRHYENGYTSVEFPCRWMDIQIGEDVLRLNLE